MVFHVASRLRTPSRKESVSLPNAILKLKPYINSSVPVCRGNLPSTVYVQEARWFLFRVWGFEFLP